MEDPDWLASRAWFSAAFGTHPYGRPSAGTHESIARITRDDLKTFTQRILARDNMKISVVGPLSPAELGLLLDRTFGSLPAKAARVEIPEVTLASKAQTIVVQYDNTQSTAIFGMQGLKRNDPDFMAAYVMNYMLGGGGFSSRLTEEVREKRGLAYSVGSFLFPLRHAALYLGSVGTQNARMGVSMKLIRVEMEKMATGSVSDKELADAKTYLIGSYPLRFDSNASIAGELLGMQTENLGIDYVTRRNAMVEAVTKEDIARVARRLLKPDQLIVSIVGKPNLSEKAPIPAPMAALPQPASPHEAPPSGE
jgi:zinc protease